MADIPSCGDARLDPLDESAPRLALALLMGREATKVSRAWLRWKVLKGFVPDVSPSMSYATQTAHVEQAIDAMWEHLKGLGMVESDYGRTLTLLSAFVGHAPDEPVMVKQSDAATS